MATEPQPAQAETITCTYDPDVARVETWLKKMVVEMRFIELIVAVVALIVRLRNLNTHLMRRVAHLTRKRPPSETLERLAPEGLLLFSTNFRRFQLDREAFADLAVLDITRATIPRDFERDQRVHHCFEIRLAR